MASFFEHSLYAIHNWQITIVSHCTSAAYKQSVLTITGNKLSPENILFETSWPIQGGDVIQVHQLWDNDAVEYTPVFRSRLKTHLFRRCLPWLCCCAYSDMSYSDTLIVLLTYLLQLNPIRSRSYKSDTYWSITSKTVWAKCCSQTICFSAHLYGLFTPPTRTRQNCLVWSASAVWTQLQTRQDSLVLYQPSFQMTSHFAVKLSGSLAKFRWLT